MLRFIPADAVDILEVGCGNGAFASLLKETRTVRVTGIEPFDTAASSAREHMDVVIHASAEEGMRMLDGKSFDCIVFNDVLEHIADPASVLTAARSLLRSTGHIVASIPNVRYMPVLRDLLLRGEWTYADEGVLDRTHLRFFTAKSMRDMFVSCGYRVRVVEGINSLPINWKYRALNVLFRNSLDDIRHQQMAVVATS